MLHVLRILTKLTCVQDVFFMQIFVAKWQKEVFPEDLSPDQKASYGPGLHHANPARISRTNQGIHQIITSTLRWLSYLCTVEGKMPYLPI
jgi:hypothetical protein